MFDDLELLAGLSFNFSKVYLIPLFAMSREELLHRLVAIGPSLGYLHIDCFLRQVLGHSAWACYYGLGGHFANIQGARA